jgi:5'-phosphate synthase pdxT subunit
MKVVGILGYQGCIEPHEAIYARLGAPTLRVRTREELQQVDRLVIPGGESTTMLRFIEQAGMGSAIREFAKTRPVWGICAGAIISAQSVLHPAQKSLNLLDITAYRNFYGAQTESFLAEIEVVGGPYRETSPTPLSVSFIRAPRLDPGAHTPGRQPLTIAARLGDQPVFFIQGAVWASSFHIELGADTTLHERFLTI